MSEDGKKIVVRFFASLKDAAGFSRSEFEIKPGTTFAGLILQLIQQIPALKGKLDNCLTAIDHKYVIDLSKPVEGNEVAFFPPVSGGSEPISIIKITTDPLDTNKIVKEVTLPTTGAVNVFIGTVRENTARTTGDFRTIKLEYEAFEEMAVEKMRLIEGEMRKKWNEIEGIAIIQRIGNLAPGTPSVLIACAASHRDRGIFEATHYAIDRLKEIVPIWKKEISDEGEEWIEGEYKPGERD